MKKIYLLLFVLVQSFVLKANSENNSVGLKGTITDSKGNTLSYVSIYFPELKTGAVSDINGKYEMDNLPKKNLLVQISFIGYNMINENIDLKNISEKNFQMKESVVEINELVVTGQAGSSQSIKTPTPISIVSQQDLLQNSSTNIIDAISNQPGVSQITTGSGISKPVIRGLGYNRVVVINYGVRQEAQQWGDEHGVEIDEFDVNKVEILKGPASLAYGSDAMAGVINMISAPILPRNSMKINAITDYQTNNGLWSYSLNFAGHKKWLVWDSRFSQKMAHAYQNKYDGYVYNSGFQEQALSLLLGVNQYWGYSHLTMSTYQLTPGIVEGERDEVTGEFIKPVAIDANTEGEAIATESDNLSYSHQMPYQKVSHYKAVWNNNILLNEGSLNLTLSYQQNRRQEFEDILHPNQYGLYFQLHTLSYDCHYLLDENDNYSLSFGVNGMYQNSLNKGKEYLVPEYQLGDIGLFSIATKTLGKATLSGGIRYDLRHENADALYLDENEQKTNASNPNAVKRFESFTDLFNGLSGSLGISYQLTSAWNMKLNLSKGFRAPNINELAANGVHEGTIRYEIGNTSLNAESSIQLDYELSYATEHINAKLNLFANNIDNYIYSRKLNTTNGNDSIRDGYNCYQFQSGNVEMGGGELYVDLHPHPWDWLHFENSFSVVYSILKNQTDSTRYLPLTPAPKWKSDVRIDISNTSKYLNASYLSFGIEHYFKQDKIYSAYGTETPTPAYTLINAGLGTDIIYGKKKLCSLYISGSNLADIAYQSHLSRLKYAAHNNATGRIGVYNMGRNISFKLLIPINL